MSSPNKNILILTPFFSPNIGGVETHLDDLVFGLDQSGYKVFVHTYSPLTTDTKYKSSERGGNNISIRRYRWFGKNIFHKLEKYPFIDFIYLAPYLFLRTFLWLTFNHRKIDVIHSQGLNAAWMGTVFKKIFGKKLIVSLHAVYEIDKNTKTARRIAKILSRADHVLTLSEASREELLSFGVPENKMSVFRYWINLDIFQPSKIDHEKFTVLFVGRMIRKKGVRVLAEVAKFLPEVYFLFVGTGPEEEYLEKLAGDHKNIKMIGPVSNSDLSKYYNSADVLCAPSLYEEGYGRVVMEAVACGLPVIASDLGGLKEALDESVAVLIDPTVENIRNAIEKLKNNPDLYKKLQSNCRPFAEKSFPEKNIEAIIRHY
ncbi:MAG: glycosyltransferase family 4 protein [Candidatus Moranbacteria bacterium]|nr:glycosyltransferase family 4 protein [Candidatus Moranbacteria bacterium]